MIDSHTIRVNTRGHCDIINITPQIEGILSKSKIEDGLVNLFVSGSTASISTIEYEPNLVRDVEEALEKIAPEDKKYHHRETWHDDNGFSHVRATLMKPGITIPFRDKKPLLGTWQQVVLLDFDNRSREREITVTIMGD
ncbi:MAG: YjbQ family protein [Candidatus Aenigmarchaeota archaeon]|nr:YjbQ family protein [Candidatus Aenigmarchaeota archaeon]